jgi:hypothetical protein
MSAMACLQQVEMRHLGNGAGRSLQRLFVSNNFVCVVKQQAELLQEMSFISFLARVLQFVGHYSDLIDNLVKRRGCLVHWEANLEMHRATPPSNVRYLTFPTTVVLSGTLEGAIKRGRQ